MNKLNFLFKYISMDTYNKIIKEKNSYIIKNLENNYRNVCLNLEYLKQYGVNLNDDLIYNNLDNLIIESYYEIKIKELEKKYNKEEVITLIENI